MVTQPSGRAWCAYFPTSTSVNDLAPHFADDVAQFIQALQDASAEVTVSDTYRPVERAYLMHWVWEIARGEVYPQNVPALAGGHRLMPRRRL